LRISVPQRSPLFPYTTLFRSVKLWDWRRMILPLTYFIQKPFQNWTRETSRLIGTAFLYVDYEAPIDRLRAELERICRASPHWDGDVISLQVTDITDRVAQVRCLASGRNGGVVFDLRCEIREKMLAFMRDQCPEALPRDRQLNASLEASAGSLPPVYAGALRSRHDPLHDAGLRRWRPGRPCRRRGRARPRPLRLRRHSQRRSRHQADGRSRAGRCLPRRVPARLRQPRPRPSGAASRPPAVGLSRLRPDRRPARFGRRLRPDLRRVRSRP